MMAPVLEPARHRALLRYRAHPSESGCCPEMHFQEIAAYAHAILQMGRELASA